jgi:hypothetical protein
MVVFLLGGGTAELSEVRDPIAPSSGVPKRARQLAETT